MILSNRMGYPEIANKFFDRYEEMLIKYASSLEKIECDQNAFIRYCSNQ